MLWKVLGGLLLAAPQVFAQWTWSNPYPFGDEIHSIAFGKGFFVAGGNNVVFLSTNGTEWFRYSTPTHSGPLKSMAYGRGRFIAKTPADFLYSTDGVRWMGSQHHYGEGTSMATGEGFFATYDSSGILLSRDGLRWVGLYPEGVPPITGITYGHGNFVAVGKGGSVFKSANGRLWRRLAPPLGLDLLDVDYHAGRFIATTYSNIVLTSSDAIRWDWRKLSGFKTIQGFNSVHGRLFAKPSGTESFRFTPREQSYERPVESVNQMAFGKGRFVGVGLGTIVSTMNKAGEIWKVHSGGPQIRVQDFAQLNGTVIAVGGSLKAPGEEGGILVSTHPGWIKAAGIDDDLFAVEVFRNTFVAVGSGTVLSSPNGTNWVRASIEFTNTLHAVIANDDQVIAVGQGGLIATSLDGQHWTTQNLGPFDWTGIAYGRGRYVICGLESLGISDDGKHWRLFPGSAQFAIYDGNWFRIGRSTTGGGWVASSIDGENWNGTFMPYGAHKLAQGPTGFVGLAMYGRVEFWGTRGSALQSKWSSFAEFDAVRYINGEFYVGGENGRIFKGQPELE